jgi:hypothetical protein
MRLMRPALWRLVAALQVQVQGVACVILDALTRRRWVKEDELAADILVNPKQLRKTLRYLEEDQLVLRGAVRETPRDVAAVAAADGRAEGGDAPAASRIYVVRARRCAPRGAASARRCASARARKRSACPNRAFAFAAPRLRRPARAVCVHRLRALRGRHPTAHPHRAQRA